MLAAELTSQNMHNYGYLFIWRFCPKNIKMPKYSHEFSYTMINKWTKLTSLVLVQSCSIIPRPGYPSLVPMWCPGSSVILDCIDS